MFIGPEIRDELLDQIDCFYWDGDDSARAAMIRSALASAPVAEIVGPRAIEVGHMVDDQDWSWEDHDFLKMLVDCIEEDLGHLATSRGINMCDTRIGQQIRALRDK